VEHKLKVPRESTTRNRVSIVNPALQYVESIDGDRASPQPYIDELSISQLRAIFIHGT
jgi:hypothetical protein